jgi:hypothetical protein
MRNTIARVKGFGFILWQARHMAYHVMLGLLWAWYLRERWGEFNPVWIFTSVVGSVLPDIDHLNYFLGYGRTDTYTQQIFGFIRRHEWRNLFYFISTGHKNNTSLMYHNIYIVTLLALLAVIASFVDWQMGVVLFGAMVSHYLFDIADDIVQLGGINPNWKRWGRPKK